MFVIHRLIIIPLHPIFIHVIPLCCHRHALKTPNFPISKTPMHFMRKWCECFTSCFPQVNPQLNPASLVPRHSGFQWINWIKSSCFHMFPIFLDRWIPWQCFPCSETHAILVRFYHHGKLPSLCLVRPWLQVRKLWVTTIIQRVPPIIQSSNSYIIKLSFTYTIESHS